MEEIIKMWERQIKFNNNFIDLADATSEQRQAHTKEMILHLISECDEVLREINWKIHRKTEVEEVNRSRLVEEIIDLIKYAFTLAQTWNVTAEEFIKEFHRKSEVVEQRYIQEKKLSLLTDEKVIAVDIDGVLGKYPEAFINYVETKTNIDLSQFVLTEYNLYNLLAEKIPGGVDAMKKLKHEFRQSGLECDLPVYEDGAETLRYFKSQGFKIVLLTARPYKLYPRFFADTIEWLKFHNIPYDAIMWDENKEDRIVKEFPLMQFMIEDNLENANKVARKGYKVYLIDKTYNSGLNEPSVIRVYNWEEIMKNESRKI